MTSRLPDWSYIAGFFDAEGTLRFTHPYVKRRKQSAFWGAVSFEVRWAQKETAVLYKIKERLSLESIRSCLYPPTPGGSSAFRLAIRNTTGSVKCLRNMLPHLVVKRQLTEDMLRFNKFFPVPMPRYWYKR